MARQYPRIGEQITRLVHSLVALKGWNMTHTMGYIGERTNYSTDMIHRWRRGRSCPSPETIETLAKIGKEEAHLPREWGRSLLKSAAHPEAEVKVSAIWGREEIRDIPHKLPHPEHTELIGRQEAIAHLQQLLSTRYGANLISVDGIGGVGKTALVLEVAHRILQASTSEVPNPKVPTFDAVIFVSAKQQYLMPDGILPRFEAQRTLQDIFREIAHTLNRFEITHAHPEMQPSKAAEALASQRTLLIVDNLETMEDKQLIVSFLYELPPTVKVVVTTRERRLFSPIRLEQLSEEATMNLVQREAQEKGVELSKEQILSLYQRIGGIPAALVYAIGQIASGFSVESVLAKVVKAGSDVARFCFEGSVAQLREQPAHHLLMAMAMFPKPSSRVAVAHSAGLTNDLIVVEESLAELQRLSLISQQHGHYRMLPLTREFALAELAAHPEFEREARERWVAWYLNFAKEHGGRDWQNWHIPFNRVEEEWEDLLAVFDWCAVHEQYDAIRTFWQSGGVLNFAIIYGYWYDCLTWLTWLIQAAESRGDWSAAVEAMKDKGHVLTLMSQLEEADVLFGKAWNLPEHADPRTKIYLAQSFAVLRIYQKRFGEAHTMLDQSRNFLDVAQLDEPEYTRTWADIQRFYGLLCYKQHDYDRAEQYFRTAVEHARAIGWQRGMIYIQNYLADIAIAQDRLEEAEMLLRDGLVVSERNKDRRRAAYYKKSFAYLYRKRGNMSEAQHWAYEAFDRFEQLGMQSDAEEMQDLLEHLQV